MRESRSVVECGDKRSGAAPLCAGEMAGTRHDNLHAQEMDGTSWRTDG